MRMMLQQDEPDDYVLATGEKHFVREFVERAFDHVGRRIAWRGKGLEETGSTPRPDISSSRSILGISVLPRLTFCSAIPERRDKSSAGATRRALRTWSGRWSRATASRCGWRGERVNRHD
jgi:hypothetical protein